MMANNPLLNNVPAGAKITVELASGKRVTYVKETKEQIIKRKHGKLIGNPITVTEAIKKYNIPRSTIINWIDNEYISVIKPGYGMQVNEAEIAYCADVYHERKESGIGFRAPLLDNDGLPYKLKHPALSKYRRRKKQTA